MSNSSFIGSVNNFHFLYKFRFNFRLIPVSLLVNSYKRLYWHKRIRRFCTRYWIQSPSSMCPSRYSRETCCGWRSPMRSVSQSWSHNGSNWRCCIYDWRYNACCCCCSNCWSSLNIMTHSLWVIKYDHFSNYECKLILTCKIAREASDWFFFLFCSTINVNMVQKWFLIYTPIWNCSLYTYCIDYTYHIGYTVCIGSSFKRKIHQGQTRRFNCWNLIKRI